MPINALPKRACSDMKLLRIGAAKLGVVQRSNNTPVMMSNMPTAISAIGSQMGASNIETRHAPSNNRAAGTRRISNSKVAIIHNITLTRLIISSPPLSNIP